MRTALSIRRSGLPIGASLRNHMESLQTRWDGLTHENAAASYELTTLFSKCLLACSILLKAEQLIPPVDAPGNNSSTICKIR